MKYHLVAIFVVAVWGTTFISTKKLLSSGLTPDDILFYRFLLAYIGIWFWGEKRLLSRSVKDEALFVLLGITGGSLYFLTENFALKFTHASNVALIVCVAPLFTAILSRLFLKNERLGLNFLFGSILAFMGVALVVFNGSFMLELNPWGDFLSISAALCWAIYTILLKDVSLRYSIRFITRKVFFYGILTILPVFCFDALNTDKTVLTRFSVWGNLLYLGLAGSLLCYFLWNMCLKKIGTIKVTNYIYAIPLVALVSSSFILHEKITWIALLGAGLILLGMFYAMKNSRH